MGIVLASTSPYRRALLERLGLEFDVLDPQVEETPSAGESAQSLVARLAADKARSVARCRPHSLIIGADQVAVLGGRIVGKPADHDENVRQLSDAAGRCVEFLTGVCLLNASTGAQHTDVVAYRVRFRFLSTEQIDAYVRRERAYDCAGGFRCEGLGAALLAEMGGEDPTALIGLPLITLVTMLHAEGVDPLTAG